MIKRLSSIFNMTCPRCYHGKLYVSPFNWRKPMLMQKECPVCGQKFEPEPGFYYGAMFISYIFIGFFSLGFTLLSVFAFGLSFELTFGLLLGVLAIMFFWNLRFSRSIWIHLVVRHDREATKKGVSPKA
jgi:uncharacterized protein (DUF983 family)